MLVFILYLFQTLPELIPKTVVEFTGRLGEYEVRRFLLVALKGLYRAPSRYLRDEDVYHEIRRRLSSSQIHLRSLSPILLDWRGTQTFPLKHLL